MADNYSINDFRSYFSMVIDKFLNEYLEGFNTPVLLFFGLFLYFVFQNKRMMKEVTYGNQQLLSRICEMETSNATVPDEVKEVKNGNQQFLSKICDMEISNTKIVNEVKVVKNVNQQLLSRICDVETSNTKMADKIDTLEIGYNKLSDKASSLDMDNIVQEKYRLYVNDENKKLVDYINDENKKIINYVNDVDRKIAGSVRSLEGLLHQENQALEKSIVSKLQEWEPVVSKIQEWEDRIAIQSQKLVRFFNTP